VPAGFAEVGHGSAQPYKTRNQPAAAAWASRGSQFLCAVMLALAVEVAVPHHRRDWPHRWVVVNPAARFVAGHQRVQWPLPAMGLELAFVAARRWRRAGRLDPL